MPREDVRTGCGGQAVGGQALPCLGVQNLGAQSLGLQSLGIQSLGVQSSHDGSLPREHCQEDSRVRGGKWQSG